VHGCEVSYNASLLSFVEARKINTNCSSPWNVDKENDRRPAVEAGGDVPSDNKTKSERQMLIDDGVGLVLYSILVGSDLFMPRSRRGTNKG
jgi:hypothetical protein